MGTLGALAEINPLRYRGYYFDTEIGLYYLKGRYYDPFVCRFINADNYQSTGQDIIGCNMFAYCGNDPISRKDDAGDFWGIVVGAAVGGLVGAVFGAINASAAGEDVGTGALYGALAGVVISLVGAGAAALASVVGTWGLSASMTSIVCNSIKGAGMCINAAFGARFDYLSQKQQFNIKAKNGLASGDFEPDYTSMLISAASVFGSTFLSYGLPSTNVFLDDSLIDIIGGGYINMSAGVLEMSARWISSNPPKIKTDSVKTRKALPYNRRWNNERILMW